MAEELNAFITYEIMWKDTCVCRVSMSEYGDIVSCEKPVGDTLRQPIHGEVTTKKFYQFLKSRCFEDGRADLPELLKIMQMDRNNPYLYIRATHCAMFQDKWWVRKQGEQIQWKEVDPYGRT